MKISDAGAQSIDHAGTPQLERDPTAYRAEKRKDMSDVEQTRAWFHHATKNASQVPGPSPVVSIPQLGHDIALLETLIQTGDSALRVRGLRTLGDALAIALKDKPEDPDVQAYVRRVALVFCKYLLHQDEAVRWQVVRGMSLLGSHLMRIDEVLDKLIAALRKEEYAEAFRMDALSCLALNLDHPRVARMLHDLAGDPLLSEGLKREVISLTELLPPPPLPKPEPVSPLLTRFLDIIQKATRGEVEAFLPGDTAIRHLGAPEEEKKEPEQVDKGKISVHTADTPFEAWWYLLHHADGYLVQIVVNWNQEGKSVAAQDDVILGQIRDTEKEKYVALLLTPDMGQNAGYAYFSLPQNALLPSGLLDKEKIAFAVVPSDTLKGEKMAAFIRASQEKALQHTPTEDRYDVKNTWEKWMNERAEQLREQIDGSFSA